MTGLVGTADRPTLHCSALPQFDPPLLHVHPVDAMVAARCHALLEQVRPVDGVQVGAQEDPVEPVDGPAPQSV